MRSNFQIKSKLVISYTRDGVTKEHTRTTNMMLSIGQEFIYKMWTGQTTYDLPNWIGIGTGTIPPTIFDTALEDELGVRYQHIAMYRTEYPWYRYYRGEFYNLAGGLELNEAGIFNAETGGEMFNRAIFDTFITKAGDDVVITWTLYFSPEAV